MTPRALTLPARLAGQPILKSQSDDRLVDLARAGNEPAFEAIVSRYRGELLRYATRLLDAERAEDAVQQTFVNAYDAIKKNDAELNLRPWLYRITHNLSINALRDGALRHVELDESIDGVERPEQAFERSARLDAVINAIQELPPRQRDALVLQAVDGRSYEEVAETLGVSGGSVRQLLNRARVNLRAAATAITPLGLITRIPFETASEPASSRVAELTAGAGASAMLTKATAAVLVTGAAAGGVAKIEHDRGARADERPAAVERSVADHGGQRPRGLFAPAGSGEDRRHARGRSGSGSSGHGGGSSEGRGRRGSSGTSGRSGHSGSGQPGDRRGSDDSRRSNSGSGSGSGSDDSRSGSGSDDSRSGSGSSSSPPGSDEPGSGSSGSGSTGSRSGSSGGGEGRSGSGRDDAPEHVVAGDD